MNVLVCDDERQIVDSIIETLEKKTEETQVSSRFYGFSQPSQIDLSLPYDIALLDIDMGETNGIELARKLRAENENIVIIFITNFIQYAPEGFEVQAFRYLLKADLSAKLDSYFDSAVQEVLRRKQLVTISINSEIIDVPVNDILYLESHRRIIVMHLLDEKSPAYQFYGNITELSEKSSHSVSFVFKKAILSICTMSKSFNTIKSNCAVVFVWLQAKRIIMS